jgi:hypothetical protein
VKMPSTHPAHSKSCVRYGLCWCAGCAGQKPPDFFWEGNKDRGNTSFHDTCAGQNHPAHTQHSQNRVSDKVCAGVLGVLVKNHL